MTDHAPLLADRLRGLLCATTHLDVALARAEAAEALAAYNEHLRAPELPEPSAGPFEVVRRG